MLSFSFQPKKNSQFVILWFIATRNRWSEIDDASLFLIILTPCPLGSVLKQRKNSIPLIITIFWYQIGFILIIIISWSLPEGYDCLVSITYTMSFHTHGLLFSGFRLCGLTSPGIWSDPTLYWIFCGFINCCKGESCLPVSWKQDLILPSFKVCGILLLWRGQFSTCVSNSVSYQWRYSCTVDEFESRLQEWKGVCLGWSSGGSFHVLGMDCGRVETVWKRRLSAVQFLDQELKEDLEWNMDW